MACFGPGYLTRISGQFFIHYNSTLVRALLRLIEPTHGRLTWKGEDMLRLGKTTLAQRRREVQLLPGDLLSPLSPPSGCVFRTRYPEATELCGQQNPTKTGSMGHHIYRSNMNLGSLS